MASFFSSSSCSSPKTVSSKPRYSKNHILITDISDEEPVLHFDSVHGVMD
ncbi:hypothetical protein M378DRAFT_18792 [Amanita muscaria Koide BX008]|uniref:Uncharacterized protein n=1 Tax=Amanita muscaria (strain Koide BX008) TaxID=946122 RepID=A0A0C2WDA6_AMAMK|nr:hypothetical protein M378DRAFT_18792 [Amanita muscaria Koide BX008]